MKLIAQVRLNPTDEQAQALLQTLKQANAACNAISQRAWETRTGGTICCVPDGASHGIRRIKRCIVSQSVSKSSDQPGRQRPKVPPAGGGVEMPGRKTYDPLLNNCVLENEIAL